MSSTSPYSSSSTLFFSLACITSSAANLLMMPSQVECSLRSSDDGIFPPRGQLANEHQEAARVVQRVVVAVFGLLALAVAQGLFEILLFGVQHVAIAFVLFIAIAAIELDKGDGEVEETGRISATHSDLPLLGFAILGADQVVEEVEGVLLQLVGVVLDRLFPVERLLADDVADPLRGHQLGDDGGEGDVVLAVDLGQG